jgi:hypothetical protein
MTLPFMENTLPVVTQPTMSVHMAGHIRVQIPASKEAQAVFDLLTPDMKQNPDKHLFIFEEASASGEFALGMLRRTLSMLLVKETIRGDLTGVHCIIFELISDFSTFKAPTFNVV